MLTWSTSTTSLNPNGNRNGKSETRVGEEFLKAWDDAVFDGKVISGDPELNREAARWREKFPHIRVVGMSCGEHKVMHPLPVSQSLSIMNHSKSADYVREKISNGSTTAHLKSTLPKIVDSKRLLRK
ncbi:hypothetical protein GCK72_016362 [Caenorhabditis remanei]|uniref:DUF3719 domain-containing protein n=1 Tax=Caenorhabditis remanei TaxID=31234 RepID=A0A6A5GZ83_CAERE|nr:hypothetical protein GCK72_016362 [Caenorhabditis remanei]KAF1759895.1 hypothetical protein GCK72_016362 [Caenorhabditis remanei]